MTSRQRRQDVTPAQRRADEAAETILEASGLRYQSGQIPGLARILMAFAENEIRLAYDLTPSQSYAFDQGEDVYDD